MSGFGQVRHSKNVFLSFYTSSTWIRIPERDFIPSLHVTTTYQHPPPVVVCFVTRWSPGAFLERVQYRFGYRTARVPCLHTRDWTKARPGQPATGAHTAVSSRAKRVDFMCGHYRWRVHAKTNIPCSLQYTLNHIIFDAILCIYIIIETYVYKLKIT